MERLRSELFRKVWKYRKYQKGSRKPGRPRKGKENELLPRKALVRVHECYGNHWVAHAQRRGHGRLYKVHTL